MDAFYASVELLRRPELRGQPLVIGGRRAVIAGRPGDWPRLRDYTGRGVVTTATYEARARGVSSGMGLMKAAALAPDALLLPADFDEYRRLSTAFKQAVAELAPAIEDRGIDEIYIELTGLPGVADAVAHDPLGGLRALVQDIKNLVRERTGLSCSVGIARNKLLAKICSDLDKPDGLTLLTPAEIPTRLWPLPVRRIQGVGPKAGARLEAMGIHRIGDLAVTPLDALAAPFGASQARWLHDAANGRDERPVVTYSEPVSVSRETTFEHDLHPKTDRAALSTIFTDLCTRVAQDLQRKGYRGRTIGIKLRFDDFRTVTRDHTLEAATADARSIREAAGQCLKRILLSRRLRLLGVRVGNLERLDGQPMVMRTAIPAPSVSQAGTTASSRPGHGPERHPRPARARVDTDTLPLFGADEDSDLQR
ncbi:DNA polymerase-4 [Sphaerotilus hippei]|uniref:DNA polymerase IV n=2 Tax=Sphaerotilus hippei TaxID=744406 RepID=A0A318HC42_9BURK|nr:DNA polymerase-4 [Sphaerotilus hippei]